MNQELKNLIALSLVPLVGSVRAKELIMYFGSAEAVLKEKKSNLEKITNIGEVIASNIKKADFIKLAEEELNFISKNNIKCLAFNDEDYPYRLSNCSDCPLIIYYQGNFNLNPEKSISIVGTRQATLKGIDFINEFIASIKKKLGNITIVSGYAYGVDIQSHIAAMDNSLETIAVLGHGFNKIYPTPHKKYKKNMLKNGGFITEFRSFDVFDRNNFISRNRIIAGLSDCTIVIESADKGGSLITADFANDYNREVFAVPGRPNEIYSKGCNNLIYQNKAILLQDVESLIKSMNCDSSLKKTKPIQIELSLYTNNEQKIIEAIKQSAVSYDELLRTLSIPNSELVNSLLSLELQGVIKCLPGKVYELKN